MPHAPSETFDLVYKSANGPNRRYLFYLVRRLREMLKKDQRIEDHLDEMISSAEQWDAFVERVSAYAGDADAPELIDKMLAELYWYSLHPATWHLLGIHELANRQGLPDLASDAEDIRRSVAESVHRLVVIDQNRSSRILS